jgi:hypothetical protein
MSMVKYMGDIFIDVDELKVVKIEDLISYVQSNKHVVDPVVFTVHRNGEIIDLNGIVQSFVPSVLPGSI